MATALLDIGFLGAISLILWLAHIEERWLERDRRARPDQVAEPSSMESESRRRSARRPPRAA